MIYLLTENIKSVQVSNFKILPLRLLTAEPLFFHIYKTHLRFNVLTFSSTPGTFTSVTFVGAQPRTLIYK